MKGWREYILNSDFLALLSIVLTYVFGILAIFAFIETVWQGATFSQDLIDLKSYQVTLLHAVRRGHQNLEISIKQLGLTETAHYRMLRTKYP